MDQSSDFDRMPQTIGRYEVQDSIGFGAMGAVYKAFDPRIKRLLAIKTIRLDIPRQSPEYKTFIERFYHEARISGTLSHPNIVTLFDIGEERGIPYLAMEYVEGETLAALIDRGERFAPEKVIALVSQIASAIDYAHTKGVIHRDIKPSNLILHDGERVKVTDFGIAKMMDTEMTAQGQMLGTPSYMSPEQAMGEKVDGRTDIFSLGVCAFEMLSGEQPFPGNNVTAILYKLVHADPIEPANLELRGLVPHKWHEVFRKVLAKRPDERYQTGAEFVRDLELCLGSWFGAAMGDETVAEPASESDATVTLARGAHDTRPPGPSPDVTAAMPPAPPRPATATLPPAPVGETVMFPSGAVPPGASDGATVRVPVEGATVLMPSAEVEPTLRAPLPQAPTAARRAPTPPPIAGPTDRMVQSAPARTPPRAPGRGPKLGLAVAGLVVFALVALGGVGYLFLRDGTAEPAPGPSVEPATPAPATPEPVVFSGTLLIDSDPPGASVSVDGEPRGLTPLTLRDLAVGAYAITLERSGYETFRQRVTLSEATPRAELKPVLERAAPVPPTQATLTVLSTPFGAGVTLDGTAVGQTPLTNLRVRPGSHRVELRKPGYEPWSQTIDAAAGRNLRVDATLKAVAPPPTPAAATPDPDRVHLNMASEVDTPARRVGGTSVSYPDNAPRLRSGESISVRVSFVVDERGQVTELKVVESAGKIVDEAVVSAIKTWSYSPAVKRGVKVKVRIEMKQTFRAG
jgi:serine/threonine-protein kinase